MADFDPLFVDSSVLAWAQNTLFSLFSYNSRLLYYIWVYHPAPIPIPIPMVYLIKIVDCFGEQAIRLIYFSVHLFLSRCLQVTAHLKKQLKHTSKEPEENRNLCLCIPRRVKLELLSICLVDMYCECQAQKHNFI